MPNPLLNNDSPYLQIFGSFPNYKMLRVVGCLGYPWFRPYTQNKLQPPSSPCVFLGYSLNQSAINAMTQSLLEFFISRQVDFVEHEFPFKTIQLCYARVCDATVDKWTLHFIFNPYPFQSHMLVPLISL